MPDGSPPRSSGGAEFAGFLIAVAIIAIAVFAIFPQARAILPDFDAPSTSAPDLPPAGRFDLEEARRSYPGDHASKRDKARWMGHWAGRAGLPPELPVMAALVESNLTNHQVMLDHDSLGYFQMRKSIWERDYPRYWERPELQLKWFIDKARSTRTDRLAQVRHWGEWCAEIERPKAEYRGRYQPRLKEARELLG